MRIFGVVLVCVITAVSVAAVAAVHLHSSETVVLKWRDRRIAEFHTDEGHSFVVHLPDRRLSGHEKPSLAQVLEDGVPLGPANALHQDVRGTGLGRFSYWNKSLLVSTSDNSDPRINGRKYEIRAPIWIAHWLKRILLINAAAWCVLAAIVLNRTLIPAARALASLAEFCNGWIVRVFAHPSFATAALVFAAALLLQSINCALRFHDPKLAETGLCIFGTPFSDARGWYTQGKSIAVGQGLHACWLGMRPGYGIFLAMFYTWFGASHLVGVGANMVLVSLTAALICRIGEQLLNRWVGVVAALGFLLLPMTNVYPLNLASETLGLFGAVLTVHLLLRGVETGEWQPLLFAGFFMGASNLARPLTLPALPFALLVVVASQLRTAGLKSSLLKGATFGCGLTLALAPWLFRQWWVLGILAVSDNTAECLFAATSPKYQSWTNEIYLEPDYAPANAKEKYEFFMNKAKANLRSNPTYYVQNVVDSYAGFLNNCSTTVRQPLHHLGIVVLAGTLAFSAAWRLHGARRAALCALALGSIGAYSYLSQLQTYWLDVAMFLLLPLLCRRAVSFAFVGMTIFSIFGIAMFGMTGADPRLIFMAQWTFVLARIAVLGAIATHLVNLVSPVEARVPILQPLSAPPVSRWYVYLRGAVVCAALVSGARLAYLNAVTVVPPTIPQFLPDDRAVAIVRELAAFAPDLLSPDDLRPERIVGSAKSNFAKADGKLVVLQVRLYEPSYALPKNVKLNHWSRYFVPRNYDRTLCYFHFRGVPHPFNCEYQFPAMFPGSVPGELFDRECILVCRVRYDDSTGSNCEFVSFEGVAIIPRDADDNLVLQDSYIARDSNHAPFAGVLTNGPR